MNKVEAKKETVKKLKEKFEKSGLTVLTDYRGLTVGEITDLRKRLNKNNAEYKIAKNTLIKLAIKDANLGEFVKFLEGPTALLISYGEPNESAKTLVEFIKEIEKGEIKAAYLDGKFLTKDEIKTFASLPSRDVLMGQIAFLLVSGVQGITSVFEGLIRDVALLVEEVAKKNENRTT